MQIIKQLFNFYLNSSIHVALAVYALSWITLKTFNIIYDENILYFNFYATITGYNFVKYFGVAKFHHRSLTIWLKVIQVFSLVCFILLCYYALQLDPKILLYIASFAVITFLYAIPFLPKRLYMDSQQNLRSISGLKVYIIALVWSGVTVLLPLINNSVALSADVWIMLLQHYIYVIVLMLPFEIRDLRYDSLKLSTIPQKIGIKRTKFFGVLLLILFFLLDFFKDNLTHQVVWIRLVITCITGLFLIFTNKKRSKYYSSFWVESIPILWLLIFIISQFFFESRP
ncbi:hypothetical protein [Pontimicrobium sp. MEBiC01747]